MANFEYVLSNGLRFNPNTAKLTRDGSPINLPPRHAKLLTYLLENNTRYVSYDDFFEPVFGGRTSSENLRSQMTALRRAIGDNGAEMRLIHTERNLGYKYVGQCQKVPILQEALLPAIPALNAQTQLNYRPALTPFESNLVVHRIRHTDEPEFEQFLEIFEEELHDQVADSAADFEAYLTADEASAASEPNDIYLVAKFGNNSRLSGVVAAIVYLGNVSLVIPTH